MSLLSNTIKSKKFDVRMIERSLNKAVLTHKEVEEQLKQLPDDGDNAAYMNLEELAQGTIGKSGLRRPLN